MGTERTTVDNPLLDAWLEHHGSGAPYRWMDRSRDLTSTWARGRDQRRHLNSVFSFAVPTPEVLDLIVGYGPVVEIGAGTGYWARLLTERGCDILAFDLLGEAFDKWFPSGQYGDVEKGGTEKAAEHADRTLLLVWPPYDEPMALDALTAYRDAGGQRLIYVGEGCGGCTGDEAFHDALEGPGWTEVCSMAMPQWDGINDWFTVYERSASRPKGRP